GGARHQLAGAIAHVKLRLHKQQPIEQVVAKIEFNVAGEANQNPARPEGEDTLEGDDDYRCQAINDQGPDARWRIGGYQQMHEPWRHLTQPPERLSISRKTVHDHAKGKRLERSDNAHSGESQHSDGDLSFGPCDIRKQLFEVLPTGDGFRGWQFRRLRREYCRTRGAAHLSSEAGMAQRPQQFL